MFEKQFSFNQRFVGRKALVNFGRDKAKDLNQFQQFFSDFTKKLLRFVNAEIFILFYEAV